MTKHRARAKGFTLIELMVTVSLVVILMAVAVPSLTTFQRNAQLTSFSNTMLASINAARGEAMKRGQFAVVVPSDGTNWSSGWIVFVDVAVAGATPFNGVYDSASDITILTQPAPPSYLTITFDASGYSKTKAGGFGALTFEVKRNDATGADALAQTRRIKVASTGRVRVCTPVSSPDALCLATSGL